MSSTKTLTNLTLSSLLGGKTSVYFLVGNILRRTSLLFHTHPSLQTHEPYHRVNYHR